MNFLPNLLLLRWDIARSLHIEHYPALEHRVRVSAFLPSNDQPVQHRVDAGKDKLRVASQIPGRIEQPGGQGRVRDPADTEALCQPEPQRPPE